MSRERIDWWELLVDGAAILAGVLLILCAVGFMVAMVFAIWTDGDTALKWAGTCLVGFVAAWGVFAASTS